MSVFISVLRFTQGSLPDPAKAPLANADHASVAAVPTAVQGKDEKFLARAEREQISVAGEDI